MKRNEMKWNDNEIKVHGCYIDLLAVAALTAHCQSATVPPVKAAAVPACSCCNSVLTSLPPFLPHRTVQSHSVALTHSLTPAASALTSPNRHLPMDEKQKPVSATCHWMPTFSNGGYNRGSHTCHTFIHSDSDSLLEASDVSLPSSCKLVFVDCGLTTVVSLDWGTLSLDWTVL